MRWLTAVLLASLVASALPAQAADAPTAAPPAAPIAADCGGNPCGYIIPNIDLDFPDKKLCGGGRLIYADEPPTDCYPLMAVGESQEIQGTFRMYWDAQEEPTYPINPNEPIVVTFSGTASNPKWLDVKVDPAEILIGIEELYNQENYDVRPEESPILWFEYTENLTITVTRTGDPSEADLDKMRDRHGVIPVFVKARSSESGAYYKEAFGVEEFRFQGCAQPEIEAKVCPQGKEQVPQGEEIPGVAPVAIMALLAAIAVSRRRR